jgi:hypothetical protein
MPDNNTTRQQASLQFTEGGRLALDNCPNSGFAFQIALFASMSLEGKPVRCNGIVPSVSLLIEAERAEVRAWEIDNWCDSIWQQIRPALVHWVNNPEKQTPIF